MSLITYPIATAPDAFCPQNFAAQMRVNQRAHASPFGGSEQVVDMLNDRWAVTMDLPPCTQDDASQREAFFNALRGQVNHTELYHFGRPTPRGTLASSQGLIFDAPQGAASVTIATTAGATLLAGDMLGVDGLLLQCAADCVADSSGVLVVPLVNRLRRAVSGLRRASTATYIDGAGVLQTAAVDEPRFQGGALLVEEARTNSVVQSQNLTSTWEGCSRTLAAEFWAGNVPFYEVAKLLTTQEATISTTMSVMAGETYTLTIALLAGNKTTCTVGLYGSVIRPNGFWGEPADCTQEILSGPGTLAVFNEFVGALWHVDNLHATIPTVVRITRTYTDNMIGRCYIYPGRASSTTVGDSVKVTRVQIERGATATSYIPTTTVAVTRSADIIAPVTWDRPTAPFRLVSSVAPRYVPGYAEGLSLDFVEKVD